MRMSLSSPMIVVRGFRLQRIHRHQVPLRHRVRQQRSIQVQKNYLRTKSLDTSRGERVETSRKQSVREGAPRRRRRESPVRESGRGRKRKGRHVLTGCKQSSIHRVWGRKIFERASLFLCREVLKG